MPLVGTGRETCTACNWNKQHAKVDRWFDQERFEWRYTRRCAWCGSLFPATKGEYESENPNDPNRIWGELARHQEQGGPMTIIDTLNAKVARDRASDDEVARIVGVTPAELDADTTAADPAPTYPHAFWDRSTAQIRIALGEVIHDDEPAYIGSRGLITFVRDTGPLPDWAMYRYADQQTQDARDLHDTQQDALL